MYVYCQVLIELLEILLRIFFAVWNQDKSSYSGSNISLLASNLIYNLPNKRSFIWEP